MVLYFTINIFGDWNKQVQLGIST